MADKSKKSKKAKKAKKTHKAKHAEQSTEFADETGVVGSVDGSKRKMKRTEYEDAMEVLQGELVVMQEWVKATGAKICVVFEGLDSAGKGGTIRRITERTSPRVFKHIALPAPNERERSQMYIQRYVAHFPSAGQITGPNAFRFKRSTDAVGEYQQEHVDLINSIRSGQPLNEAQRIAETTLTAIMGRMSAYTGKEVLWDTALNSHESLFPGKLEMGPIATPAVATPGKTQLT